MIENIVQSTLISKYIDVSMHRKIEEEPILIGHLVRSSETVLENEPEFLSISENLRHKEII